MLCLFHCPTVLTRLLVHFGDQTLQPERSVDAYSIPVIGCGPSQLSSSRTTHAQADPARAETRSHERTMAHQPYAEGNVSRADNFPYRCLTNEYWLRSHNLRRLPEPFRDRLSVKLLKSQLRGGGTL